MAALGGLRTTALGCPLGDISQGGGKLIQTSSLYFVAALKYFCKRLAAFVDTYIFFKKLLLIGFLQQGSRGVEDTGIIQPPESTKQSSSGLTQTGAASMEPAWLCPSSLKMLWLLAWCFCGIPGNVSGGVSDSLTCSWDPLPPSGLPCPTLIGGLCLILSLTC